MFGKVGEAQINNTEIIDINCPPPIAALRMARESTKLIVSNLDGLKMADK